MVTALLLLAHIDRSVVAHREMLLHQQSEHAHISQIFRSNVQSPFSSNTQRCAYKANDKPPAVNYSI